ncbi:MAG: ATP-grasp domain-containing protein, partial [Planctomycetota bacterium]
MPGTCPLPRPPAWIWAKTPAEAAAAYTALGTPICAVKAQIHAGGRGKGQVP